MPEGPAAQGGTDAVTAGHGGLPRLFRSGAGRAAAAIVAAVSAFASSDVRADPALTDEERHAAYCYGITSERYDGYLAMCRAKGDQCFYAKELAIAEASRQVHIEVLKRQAVYGWWREREAEGVLVDEQAAAGVKDYRACFDYFQRVFQTCALVCAKHGPDCQPVCERQGSAESCSRLEKCLLPDAGAGAAGSPGGPPRRDP